MSGEWMTEPNLARARRLWDEGLSMTAMGRALGCSKNSINGFVHRNGFPPRPSPIGRTGSKRAGAHPKVARIRPPAPPAMPPGPPVAIRTCQWINGDDRKTWTMCGVAATARSPYCLEHHVRVFSHPPRGAAGANRDSA